jgi:ribose/xylose/arabinose/galactoside ABC-type transport system permease subunit
MMKRKILSTITCSVLEVAIMLVLFFAIMTFTFLSVFGIASILFSYSVSVIIAILLTAIMLSVVFN